MSKPSQPKTSKRRQSKPRSVAAPRIDPARLDALIEEATIDAYGESEQALGFFTMLEDDLALPFETLLLGDVVTVEKIDLQEDDRIIARCVRGRARQAITLEDLPLPSPPPPGAEWIEAYRRWLGRR
jgi:hypothetical protein